MSQVHVRDSYVEKKPQEFSKLKVQRPNQNLEPTNNPGDGQKLSNKQIKEKIREEIEEDKKKALLLVMGHFLYEELNDPVFKKQVLMKNGYFGGPTKFILNFASYKTGSNLRYLVTIGNIFLTLLLCLLTVLYHEGTFYTNKTNFLSFKLYPCLMLGVQIAYNIFSIFEYHRVYRGQNPNSQNKCGFSLELFSIYFGIVLWILIIGYVLIEDSAILTIVTCSLLFVSLMVDYSNVSCRNRGVSPHPIHFNHILTQAQEKNFIGSYDMCVIKLVILIYIMFNNSRRDVVSKYGTVIAVCILLYFYHLIQIFTQFQAFLAFKKFKNKASLLHPHRKY